MFPPTALTSPPTRARERIEPAKRSSSPATGAAATIEPPIAERSPDTGAVLTTETPARYAFPCEGLATISERDTEKDAGPAAYEPVGEMSATTAMMIRAGRIFLVKTQEASADTTEAQAREEADFFFHPSISVQ